MKKKTATVKVPLPISKVKMTLLDLAELIVTSEVEKQDLQRQLDEIAAAVPSRRPLLAVIKNLRACALQARVAIREHIEFLEQTDAYDEQLHSELRVALKSLDAHAL